MTELVIAPEEDGTFAGTWNDVTILRAKVTGPQAQVNMVDEPPRAACEEALDWLEERGVTTLHTRALLLRHAARRRGYAGVLRAALQRGGDVPAGDAAAQVGALLPGVRVHEAPHGRLRGIVASLTSGVSDVTRLRADAGDGRPVLTAVVPAGVELNAEAIAMALDMTLSVHARFGAASAHVDTLSFDYSSHGMASGKTAGEAARQLGVIHLNANYALAAGRAERPSGVPADLPLPWTTIDATTAHELWHKIELAWETERYADSIEFRRAVGGLVGVDTIEKVFFDDAARATLAAGVSEYATTNRVEATAEMFKRYWCGPPPKGSIAEQFGAIVDRFF